MPCYTIKSSQKNQGTDLHNDNSLTSFWDYVNKKHHISVIDCLFLNDEFLLVIDSELVGHIHYFRRRTKENKGKFRSYTVNFNNNEGNMKEQPSKNLEFKKVLCFGGENEEYWYLVMLMTKKDYDLNTKQFSNLRSCFKVYSIAKREDILNFVREIDFGENGKMKTLKNLELENVFKKHEKEIVGFDGKSSKMFRFELKDKGDLDLLGVKDVKSQEDSLYLIISGCKSARRHDELTHETPKRNSVFKASLDLREKLNLD